MTRHKKINATDCLRRCLLLNGLWLCHRAYDARMVNMAVGIVLESVIHDMPELKLAQVLCCCHGLGQKHPFCRGKVDVVQFQVQPEHCPVFFHALGHGHAIHTETLLLAAMKSTDPNISAFPVHPHHRCIDDHNIYDVGIFSPRKVILYWILGRCGSHMWGIQ